MDSRSRALALFAVLVLVGAACSQDGGGGTADGEIKTDIGVTEEPCPDAVNEDNGCIYLGTLSDLTEGPFAALAVPLTAAQAAFWNRVNEAGGIGGAYDVDATEYVRDNKYNPEVQVKRYRAIASKVLALAQTLGTPPTQAILADLQEEQVVSVPASWWSGWEFEDVILESGSNYCLESMNAVDYAVEEFDVKTMMTVHYPGDYGGDAAVGAEHAAEANGLEIVGNVETAPNAIAGSQAKAVGEIVKESPDLVILTTGPAEAAEIVGGAAAEGFTGKFIGTSPTWNPGLLATPAAGALEALYMQSGPWGPYGTDTPGHEAMRTALGDPETLNDGFTAGWVWSYPLKQVLENAYDSGDLTRAGVFTAAGALTTVDYEGMLPADAGNFAGEPNDTVFRQNVISKVDKDAPTGVSVVRDFFTGPTAEAYDFSAACQALS